MCVLDRDPAAEPLGQRAHELLTHAVPAHRPGKPDPVVVNCQAKLGTSLLELDLNLAGPPVGKGVLERVGAAR